MTGLARSWLCDAWSRTANCVEAAIAHWVSIGQCCGRQRGVATGAVIFLRTIGGAIGAGLLGATLAWELAHRLAYAIDHASATDIRLRQAADLMRSWDGTVSSNSSAAAVTAAAESAFWPMLLRPKLGDEWRLYHWSESDFAREQLITHNPSGWLPSGYASWDDFLAAVVKEGLHSAPLMLKTWHYGDAHPIDVRHPLYGNIPWVRKWTGTGWHPHGGDTTTVDAAGHTFGPSQRFTIDWSNPDAATENLMMGESGDPLSQYYNDQWTYWYSGKTFTLPFSDAAVQAQTAHTLLLLP